MTLRPHQASETPVVNQAAIAECPLLQTGSVYGWCRICYRETPMTLVQMMPKSQTMALCSRRSVLLSDRDAGCTKKLSSPQP